MTMNKEREFEVLVNNIINAMTKDLSDEQLRKLKDILYMNLNNYNIERKSTEITLYDNSREQALQDFLNTKNIEGKSEKTIMRYHDILMPVITSINKSLKDITTSDLRAYLSQYKQIRKVSDNTLDGMRRIINSFFTWLTTERYIQDNPASRLIKIKCEKKVKTIITDEQLELLKIHCKNDRDIAMIDLLYSSGIRVGELTELNIDNVDFDKKEIIVHGKGNKQRTVFFNGSTKVRLQKYLSTRTDNNAALFVTLHNNTKTNEPKRFSIRAIETRLNLIAEEAGLENIHPHKFRRSCATAMAKRGIGVQDISVILGHEKISTTQEYLVSDNNEVKRNYEKMFA